MASKDYEIEISAHAVMTVAFESLMMGAALAYAIF
jgi:hypothetical protein